MHFAKSGMVGRGGFREGSSGRGVRSSTPGAGARQRANWMAPREARGNGVSGSFPRAWKWVHLYLLSESHPADLALSEKVHNIAAFIDEFVF